MSCLVWIVATHHIRGNGYGLRASIIAKSRQFRTGQIQFFAPLVVRFVRLLGHRNGIHIAINNYFNGVCAGSNQIHRILSLAIHDNGFCELGHIYCEFNIFHGYTIGEFKRNGHDRTVEELTVSRDSPHQDRVGVQVDYNHRFFGIGVYSIAPQIINHITSVILLNRGHLICIISNVVLQHVPGVGVLIVLRINAIHASHIDRQNDKIAGFVFLRFKSQRYILSGSHHGRYWQSRRYQKAADCSKPFLYIRFHLQVSPFVYPSGQAHFLHNSRRASMILLTISRHTKSLMNVYHKETSKAG